MRNIYNTIRRCIENLLHRYCGSLIELYYYYKYMRFFKGNRAVYEDIKDKVRLATSCFYIGQGITYISRGVGQLREARVNRVE